MLGILFPLLPFRPLDSVWKKAQSVAQIQQRVRNRRGQLLLRLRQGWNLDNQRLRRHSHANKISSDGSVDDNGDRKCVAPTAHLGVYYIFIYYIYYVICICIYYLYINLYDITHKWAERFLKLPS